MTVVGTRGSQLGHQLMNAGHARSMTMVRKSERGLSLWMKEPEGRCGWLSLSTTVKSCSWKVDTIRGGCERRRRWRNGTRQDLGCAHRRRRGSTGDVWDSGKNYITERPSLSGAANLGHLWTGKTLLEWSGDKEGRVDGSELAVVVNSMTTGNRVVRGLERSLDSAPGLVYSR